MIPEDFYGKKQFIWWIGVVEDVNDDLKLGRLRVRIFGIHSDDKTKVPTKQLPWAQVLLPTTGAKTTSGPREGDWVQGFFQDGEQAQVPIVTGVYGGVESKQAQIVYQEAVTRDGANNKPTSTQTDRVVGEPTNPRLSRSVIQGTLIEKSNKSLVHVCDITPDVLKATTWIRAQFGIVVKAIRDGIRALIKALGLDPSGESSKLVQLLKAIKREIQDITKVLKDINDMAQDLLKVVKQIRAMIDYILSLPDKLRAMLQDCLNKFIASIAAGIGDLMKGPIEESSTDVMDFSELKNTWSELQTASGQLYDTALATISIPGQVINTFLTPASSADIAIASTSFGNFISDSFPSDTQTPSEKAESVLPNKPEDKP